MGIQALLALVNVGIPVVGNVIVAIRNLNGSGDVLVYLDKADAQFDANHTQVQQWLAAHGKATTPTA